MTDFPPQIPDAPGLRWIKRKYGWEGRWYCRTDIRERGYDLRSRWVFRGSWPNETDIAWVKDECQRLQDEMLLWGRAGEIVFDNHFDGTIASLIRLYQTDPDSTYHKGRPATRRYYRQLCKKIEKTPWQTDDGLDVQVGDVALSTVKMRAVLRWHEQWAADGKVAMGHACVTMLRTLLSFGATIIEDAECERISGALHARRFQNPKPRTERLTAEQAQAIIEEAHKRQKPSIALTQAFQFDLMLRQKDVLGEWVPMNEPGPLSDIFAGNKKWLRGIRWEELGADLRLRHITSKRQKPIDVDLRLAPMVMAELARAYGENFTRADLPANGPIICAEHSGLPWVADLFTANWRKCATAVGVPKTVRNMDSRAGAISEATDAGAELEHVRHAATHSDIAMTQRYSRGSEEKVANVMRLRAEHRANKSGTKGTGNA